MKQYRTLRTLRLSGGIIGLSDQQAATRPRSLVPVRKGLYEIVAPVEFKRGEIIGMDNPPKGSDAVLEPVTPEKPKEPTGSDASKKSNPDVSKEKDLDK